MTHLHLKPSERYEKVSYSFSPGQVGCKSRHNFRTCSQTSQMAFSAKKRNLCTPFVKNHCCQKHEMKIKLICGLFRKFKKPVIFCKKSAKLVIFGWSTVFPPGCFVMYIFLPTIWWSFVLCRKNTQILQLPAQLYVTQLEVLKKL